MSVNLSIVHLMWQVRQSSHVVDESWTARRAVVRWRQPTT